MKTILRCFGFAVALASATGCGGGANDGQTKVNDTTGASMGPGAGGSTGTSTGTTNPSGGGASTGAGASGQGGGWTGGGQTDCVAGSGHDYLVGPGQIASLDDVPWESLGPGDTVRITWQSAHYKSKFQISGQGTEQAPIRVCGIKGPKGERPVIDGNGATTRSSIQYSWDPIQTSAVVMIDKTANDDYNTYAPQYVIIDGLEITGASQENSFTATDGGTRTYDSFGAALWIERGMHIVIRDNALHDCGLGLFSISKDDNNATVTQDLLLESNHIYSNGNSGSETEHNSYVQSLGVTYQFNQYGPLRSGAGGSALKDRSVASVIRYNQIEGGARTLDLVEAQDWENTAEADPRYAKTFAYGNIFIKDGTTGDAIHYGGDQGDETHYRPGTLYFFNNTFVLTGTGYVFQLSTTQQNAQVFNNVFYAQKGVSLYFRGGQDVNSGFETGGTITLGKNWMSSGWAVNDQYHPVAGTVTGTDKVIKGSGAPFDTSTYVPSANSALIDASDPPISGTTDYPVQFDPSGGKRTVVGSALDLGAVERP